MDAFVAAFRAADPAVRLLGTLAVAVGVGGPVVTWLLSGLIRDRALFRRLIQTREPIAAAQCRGPFSRIFLPYLGSGSGQLPLSSDAVIGSVHGALDRATRDLLEPLRLWSFVPLLLGLIGTAWNLRSLLQRQINPTTMPQLTGDMSNALLGTILGVSGALLATVLQRPIAHQASRTRSLAQQYLFEVFGRSLPERRIKLHYDDEVLAVLQQRTAAIVAEYAGALKPLARRLRRTATQSAEAAAGAQAAFTAVTQAVSDVSALSAVADRLVQAAALASSAGAVLQEQVPLIAANIDLNRQAAATVTEAAGTVKTAASTQAEASGRLTSSIESASTQVAAVMAATAANIASSVGTASNQMAAAATQLTTTSEHQRTSVENTAKQLAQELAVLQSQSKASGDQVRDLGREVGALRSAIGTFGSAHVENLARELRQAVELMVKELQTGLELIPGRVAQGVARLDVSTAETAKQLRQLETALGTFQGGLDKSRETVRALTTEMDAAASMAVQARPPIAPVALDALNDLPRALDALHGVQSAILATLRDRLPPPRPPKPRLRQRLRRFWPARKAL